MNKGQETIKNISNMCGKEPNKHAQTEITRIRTSLAKAGDMALIPGLERFHMPPSN